MIVYRSLPIITHIHGAILGEAAPAPALHLADAREDGHQTSGLRSDRRRVKFRISKRNWEINMAPCFAAKVRLVGDHFFAQKRGASGPTVVLSNAPVLQRSWKNLGLPSGYLT